VRARSSPLLKRSRVLTLLYTSRVSVLASGPVYFGQIPDDHWNPPPWINDTKMQEQMKKMDDIPRAGSIPCVVHSSHPCMDTLDAVYVYPSQVP